jgi:hypothetical protein
VSPVAFLASLSRGEFLALTLATVLVCCACGFAGALLETGNGQAQGTGTAVTGTVTDGLHLTRGSP